MGLHIAIIIKSAIPVGIPHTRQQNTLAGKVNLIFEQAYEDQACMADQIEKRHERDIKLQINKKWLP